MLITFPSNIYITRTIRLLNPKTPPYDYLLLIFADTLEDKFFFINFSDSLNLRSRQMGILEQVEMRQYFVSHNRVDYEKRCPTGAHLSRSRTSSNANRAYKNRDRIIFVFFNSLKIHWLEFFLRVLYFGFSRINGKT